jgi:excisionase family DNA binding protein
MAERAFEKHMILERPQPEWLDLKALQRYACVSERTLREWIHRATNPLPAAPVGVKILIRRSTFDRWVESHQIKVVDVGCIVDEIVAGVTGPN